LDVNLHLGFDKLTGKIWAIMTTPLNAKPTSANYGMVALALVSI
jgi:hypothetical protein